MQEQFNADKQRFYDEQKRKFEEEKQRAIAETKQKQWVASRAIMECLVFLSQTIYYYY